MHKVQSVQPYMVARKLNEGLIVVETQQSPQEPAVAGSPSLLYRFTGGMLGRPVPAPAATSSPLRFLPYGREGDVFVPRIQVLDGGLLKFCDIGDLLGIRFVGVDEPSLFPEKTVRILTRNRFRGIHPGTWCNAIARAQGDRKQLEVVIEELLPIT